VFLRLAAQYQDMVKDLVLSLEALALSLQKAGVMASCYSCGSDGSQGASLVADLLDGHAVRFLVCDHGISWVELRNGVELVKLEGAEAIAELDRLSKHLRSLQKQGQPIGRPHTSLSSPRPLR
jgi:hypothetical protein